MKATSTSTVTWTMPAEVAERITDLVNDEGRADLINSVEALDTAKETTHVWELSDAEARVLTGLWMIAHDYYFEVHNQGVKNQQLATRLHALRISTDAPAVLSSPSSKGVDYALGRHLFAL